MPGYPQGSVRQRGVDARLTAKERPEGRWCPLWLGALGVVVVAMSTGGMSQETTVPMGGVVEQVMGQVTGRVGQVTGR
eukprot:3363872-Prorocentrum_lima.AAC.1